MKLNFDNTTIENVTFDGTPIWNIDYQDETGTASLWHSAVKYVLQSDDTYYVTRNPNCPTNLITDVAIPSTFMGKRVTAIPTRAFQNCTSLKNITIPEGVITIGYEAFSGCSSLTSVTIPDSVETIGEHSFENCTQLRSLIIGDDCYATIGDYAFAGCRLLGSNGSITLGIGISAIGKYAFKDCMSIETMIVPSDVTDIGEGAFNGCGNLASITLPFVGLSATATQHESNFGAIFGWTVVDGMDGWDYEDTSSLDRIYYNYYVPSTLTSVVVTRATKFSSMAFRNYSNITSISIPATLEESYDNAFENSGITSIYIADMARWCGINFHDLDSKPRYAHLYLNNRVVNNINIPSTVTSIGEYAFSYLKDIQTVTIPASVTHIGANAFLGLINMTSLTLGRTTWKCANGSTTEYVATTNWTPDGAANRMWQSPWSDYTWDYVTVAPPTFSADYSTASSSSLYYITLHVTNPNNFALPNNKISVTTYAADGTVIDTFTQTRDFAASISNGAYRLTVSTPSFFSASITIESTDGFYSSARTECFGPDTESSTTR